MEIEILKKAANDDSILRRHLRWKDYGDFLKIADGTDKHAEYFLCRWMMHSGSHKDVFFTTKIISCKYKWHWCKMPQNHVEFSSKPAQDFMPRFAGLILQIFALLKWKIRCNLYALHQISSLYIISLQNAKTFNYLNIAILQ